MSSRTKGKKSPPPHVSEPNGCRPLMENGRMKTNRIAIILTLVNLALLVALVGRGRPVAAQDVPDVLRARSWELLDASGQSRATMTVSPGGEAVLRLRDRNGTIRVKLGADEQGSGLLLLNASTEPGAQVLATAKASTLTLTNPDGRKQVIAP